MKTQPIAGQVQSAIREYRIMRKLAELSPELNTKGKHYFWAFHGEKLA